MPQSAAQRLEFTQRRQQVVQLKACGLSYRKIGEQLGISHTAARKHFEAELRETNDATRQEIDLLRQLECERLDMMLTATYNEMAAGNLKAHDVWLKVCEQRCKLLGLYMLADEFIQRRVEERLTKEIDELLDVAEQNMSADAFEELINAISGNHQAQTVEAKPKPKQKRHLSVVPPAS